MQIEVGYINKYRLLFSRLPNSGKLPNQNNHLLKTGYLSIDIAAKSKTAYFLLIGKE